MSYGNPHIISQKYFNYDTPKEDPSKTGDPIRIFFKKIDDWNMTYDLDEYGKISIRASKPIGTLLSLPNGTDRDADISISVNTTQKRAPGIRIVGGYRYEPKWLEVDDQKNRITKSFEQESEYYKRVFPASSILTPEEFFSEQIPHFQELLKEKAFNANVSNISKETSEVQKPYNRNWKPAK